MEYKINYSYDSLMHYGVKGMKWGKVGAMAKAEEDMIRTSRDAGRAQSREVANKVNLPKFENEWKSASSALVRYAGKTHRPDKSGTGKYSSQDIDNYFNALNREDDAWKKYNAKTKKNIDKITKGAKTVSQIATNASAKASNFVSSLFGKKKGR